MFKADALVLLDNVQFSRMSFTHRNRIKGSQGKSIWLTVPVYKKGKFYQNINQVKINRTVKWQTKHFRTLVMNYANSPFFHYYEEPLKVIYSREWENLTDLNIALLKFVMGSLKVKTETYTASQMNVTGKKTDLLVSIVKALNGDVYISGAGGKNYIDEEKFRKEGISIHYYQYGSFVYPQLWGKFIPNLSVLDLLFNCGMESRNMIENKWGYEKP